MSTKLFRVVTLFAIVSMVAAGFSFKAAKAQDKVHIVWFVGLGTGTNDQQQAAEKKVVADFNASHPNIELEIQIGASFETSRDTITTLLAAGNPPDITGPVGVGGSNFLAEQWADLKPLIDKNKVDLSGFDPSLLSLYQTLNGGYSAIPFGVFPSLTYYNRALFDEAGLKYPPAKFDEQYEMPDGTKVDWNYDTLIKVAQMLTVDKNGNDATSADFDPKNVVQYGMNFQWAQLRLMLTDLQPEVFYDSKTGKIGYPDSWRKGAQWLHDAIWKYHFYPSATAEASALLQPSSFNSGNLAMAVTPLWYTCCLQDKAGKLNWDFGVVPQSFDGKYHVATDADTFRMFKTSKHPDEAFTVLMYLLNDAVPALAPQYGAFPARPEYQKAWIETQTKVYTQGVNWQVAVDSLKYADSSDQHHESNHPNWQQGADRNQQFWTLLSGDSGESIDVNAEIDKLDKDLTSIVAGTFPTATPAPTAAS
jgi:multiple sugar transport system substrate-binding protein